jgi:hypothetical protein
MNRGWYITSDLVKHELIQTNTIFNLQQLNIIELVIPSQVKNVWCNHNQLTELDIPDSVEYVDCRNNNLTELIVPDNCEVYCDPHVKVITRTMYNRSNRLKNILS